MHDALPPESPEKSDVVSSMPRAHDSQGPLDLRRVEHLLPLSRVEEGERRLRPSQESVNPYVQETQLRSKAKTYPKKAAQGQRGGRGKHEQLCISEAVIMQPKVLNNLLL